MEVAQLNTLEYGVFGGMMSLSALIGLYYGVVKRSQESMDQYFLGGKRMGILPVSVSLVCSFITGGTLLGTPNEIYMFGIQYLACGISCVVMGLFLAFVYLPVLHKLQLVSLYQYLEMRFDKSVRKLVSFIYIVYLLLFIPIVIYGPGLALNQVSGLDVMGVTTVVSVICIFYTTIGGLKAVCWADTLQGVVMLSSCLVLCVVGSIHVGGVAEVFRAAVQGDRLEILNMDPDPRVRSSLWTISVGCSFTFVSASMVNPSFLQRFTALPTLRKAQRSAIWMGVGAYFFMVSSGYMGLVLYAAYKGCDPYLSGEISKPDQILPLFILSISENMPGLAGTFIAGVVSASLSTMSTAINTVGGTIFVDFVEPILGHQSDTTAGYIIRITSVVFGLACVGLVLVVEKLGTILELTFSILGLSTGAMMGVMCLGLFFPRANCKGAKAGGLASMFFMAWILYKSREALQSGETVYNKKPVSVALCPRNRTLAIDSGAARPVHGEVFPLYEISVYYFALMGCLVSVAVGLAVSYLTAPGPPPHRELVSPLAHRFLEGYARPQEQELGPKQDNSLRQLP